MFELDETQRAVEQAVRSWQRSCSPSSPAPVKRLGKALAAATSAKSNSLSPNTSKITMNDTLLLGFPLKTIHGTTSRVAINGQRLSCHMSKITNCSFALRLPTSSMSQIEPRSITIYSRGVATLAIMPIIAVGVLRIFLLTIPSGFAALLKLQMFRAHSWCGTHSPLEILGIFTKVGWIEVFSPTMLPTTQPPQG